MVQRIIFVNLHSDWMLLKVAMVYVFKFSPAIKHSYLLKYLLDHPEEFQVCNYINDNGFSLYTNGGQFISKFLNCFSGMENWITLKINGINPKLIPVLRKESEIRPDDIVIAYNICTTNLSELKDIKAFKALSMLHFHGRKEEDEIIKSAGINCFFCEADLSKSSELFRKYYRTQLPWVVHPFVFAERFKKIRPFSERQNKCFSTGTITYKEHEEFISVYHDSCDQPARKFVKDNPVFFRDTVDCYSSDYLEDNQGKRINPNDNTVQRLYKKIYNRTHIGKQKKYFSFNMVEKFNEYKMHLVGEEILGVPGIGFVEGMACGSAFIGLDSPMYRDLGLVPGVHYIAYDGTKDGLKKIIEYYQQPERRGELERIANAGYEFVRDNFCGEIVAKRLLESLAQRKEELCWQNIIH